MKKYIFMVLAGGLFMAGCGIASVQQNSANSSADNSNASAAVDVTPNVAADTNSTAVTETTETSDEPSDGLSPEATSALQKFASFYVAEKNDRTTVVYKENMNTKTRDEVFRFTEKWSYQIPEGNTFAGFGPGIDYSSTRDQFVYADENGLYLYDLANGQKSTLIEKTGSNGETDGIAIPTWSNEGVSSGTFNLLKPQFSGDGKYISFVESFYEGIDVGVMNLSTQKVFHFHTQNDDRIGIARTNWSATGHILTVGSESPAGYNTTGLYIASDEPFTAAPNLVPDDNASVDSAVMVSENIIAYSTHPTTGDAYDSKIMSISTDGSNTHVIETGGKNTVLLNGGDAYFFVKDDADDTKDGLWIGYLVSGTSQHVVRGKAYDDYMPQYYDVDSIPLLAVTAMDKRDDNTSETRIELFDINTLVSAYTSPNSVLDGAQQFLGFVQ